MIDQKCRDAAALLAAANPDDRAGYAKVLIVADSMHGQCPGGTWCDCQHILTAHHGPVITCQKAEDD